MKDTSMRITAKRKMELERLAINISYETNVNIRYTDIVNYLIDNYQKEVKEDLVNELIDLITKD